MIKTYSNNKIFIYYPLIFVLIITFVDITSLLSYAWTLALFYVFNRIICKNELRNNFIYLHYYLLIAIILYIAHKTIIPGYIGLSGPEGGIGTDDCRYYAQLVEGRIPYLSYYGLEYMDKYPFVAFLQTLYPIYIFTPLNIIIVNLLGITFLPYYTYAFAKTLGCSDRVALYAKFLILICPFTTYFGCIIMRDMWIATFVLGALYYYSQKKYMFFAIFFALIVMVRFGSIAFLFAGLLVLVKEKIFQLSKTPIVGYIIFLAMIVSGLILIIVAFPYIQVFSNGKLEDGFFRESYVEGFLQTNEVSVLLKLALLPIPVNFIALTLFFFFCPFLSAQFFYENTFLCIKVFNGLLTPILFFFLWGPIFNASLQGLFSNKQTAKNILYISILIAFFLGMISLQPRHKTILFPFLCILAAIGVKEKSNNSYIKLFSTLAALAIIGVQLI